MKQTNEVFARHRLAIHCQQPGESLDEFLQALKALSKECAFKAVTAVQHCEESVRDAFINGLHSSLIQQWLLENKTLDFSTTIDQAGALDSAQKNAVMYGTAQPRVLSTTTEEAVECPPVVAAVTTKCFFCGLA